MNKSTQETGGNAGDAQSLMSEMDVMEGLDAKNWMNASPQAFHDLMQSWAFEPQRKLTPPQEHSPNSQESYGVLDTFWLFDGQAVGRSIEKIHESGQRMPVHLSVCAIQREFLLNPDVMDEVRQADMRQRLHGLEQEVQVIQRWAGQNQAGSQWIMDDLYFLDCFSEESSERDKQWQLNVPIRYSLVSHVYGADSKPDDFVTEKHAQRAFEFLQTAQCLSQGRTHDASVQPHILAPLNDFLRAGEIKKKRALDHLRFLARQADGLAYPAHVQAGMNHTLMRHSHARPG